MRHMGAQVSCPEPLCFQGRIDPDVAPELVGELEWDQHGMLVCGVCCGEGVIDRDMLD